MNCKTKIHIPFHLRSYYPHEKTFQSPGFFKTLRTGAELYTTSSFLEAFGDFSGKPLSSLQKIILFATADFFMVPGSPFMASER